MDGTRGARHTIITGGSSVCVVRIGVRADRYARAYLSTKHMHCRPNVAVSLLGRFNLGKLITSLACGRIGSIISEAATDAAT